MSVLVLKNVSLTVRGVDLSSYAQEVSIDAEKDVLDTTTMGNDSKTKTLGLADTKIGATFVQDFGSDTVDNTLWNMWASGATGTISALPVAGSMTVLNPCYTVDVLLPQYLPIKGKIGDLATVQVNFEGTGDLSRSTS